MKVKSSPNYRYRVGGALGNDELSYVTRESDRLFYEALKAGEFCYVLNSRQMGKSSLMVRTLKKLQADGWAGMVLDFSAKDSQITQPDRWYNGIINKLNRDFRLPENVRSWIKERDFLSPMERLAEFIDTVLLRVISQPIVIFIDEIDSTLSLPFTDDFFALIRACYNKRAENPDYNRLTFALLGVATPTDLISDKKRTPFNIGKAIDLKGFQLNEVFPLSAGLTDKVEDTQTVLQEILKWTGGQPFLTQRLCQLVVNEGLSISAGKEAETIANITYSYLIENWESQDEQEHLKTIKNRLLSNERTAGDLLELYRQIRQQKLFSYGNSFEERALQLSGLIVKRGGKVKLYNPIYEQVFNESWINAELSKLRPYAENFRAWVASGKTEPSWLLKGKALEEAEAWAEDKNLSGEDRDFLSASRTQQREEEIAEKEKEAELERERQAKEAAEDAKQVLKKANEEGKKRLQEAITEGVEKRQQAIDEGNKRLRQRTLFGTVILVAALMVGGFFGLDASKKVADADERVKGAEQKVTNADKRVDDLNEQLESKQKSLDLSQKKFIEAEKEAARKQKEAEIATEKANVANWQAQQAQQDLTQAKGEKDKLLKRAEYLKREAEDAAMAAEDAQQLAEKASQDLESANLKLESANAEIAKIHRDQENLRQALSLVTTLSDLGGKLQTLEEPKPEAAKDAFEQSGVSFTNFTGNNSKVKQVFLNSSISLAHQHLEEWEEAKEAIDKSINIIEKHPEIFSGDEGHSIISFAYFVEGNLKEETETTFPQSSYENAFQGIINPKPLTKDNLVNKYRNLLGNIDYTRSPFNNGVFPSLVRASLKKHYNFRTKELIQELKDLLQQEDSPQQKDWDKADYITSRAILSSAESKNVDQFYFSNISCSDLKTIDELWYDNSDGKYGFRVQKKIWEKLGSPTYDSPIEDWRKFYIEVGWKTEESGQFSETGYMKYYELEAFRDYNSSKHGNLPWVACCFNFRREGEEIKYQLSFLLANCNL